MQIINYEKQAPSTSIIKDADYSLTNYEDAFSIEIDNSKHYSIDYLTTALFSSVPNWVVALLRFRDFIVKPFGIKTANSFKFEAISKEKIYNKRERAVMFKVIKRTDNEIVMAEDDKHLNFRTSVMLEHYPNKNTYKVYSITIVKFNNLLGKLYFAPVKPFHKLIIKSLLKKMRENLKKAAC